MLASLRDGEHEQSAPRAPSPGLDELPELVEPARSAGLSVTVERTGSARPLGGAVELAAYRIIQESLTNVARHAPGATVTIALTYGRDGSTCRSATTARAATGCPATAGACSEVPAAGSRACASAPPRWAARWRCAGGSAGASR